MSMQKIDLPSEGFGDDDGVVVLRSLSVAIGERSKFDTELFVVGLADVTVVAGSRMKVMYAGTTILREGGDDPDHQIEALDGVGTDAHEFAIVCQAVRDKIALQVHLALDSHSTVTSDEMDRICGDDGE